MARKAEVELGGYLADVELTDLGTVRLTITGMDMSERMFEHFVASKPRMNLVEMDGGLKCFP